MIWGYIKASKFFPKYCPSIRDWKKKMTGKNGRGNPKIFSNTEKAEITKGLTKLFSDLKNENK